MKLFRRRKAAKQRHPSFQSPRSSAQLGDLQRASLLAAQTHIALLDLGDTRDEVRDTLLAKNCRGYVASATACPLNRYLRQIPGLSESVVGAERAVVYAGYERVEVTLPTPVLAFRRHFDSFGYPELMLTGYPVAL